jgi:predicted Zn-ribbon and HTH transcriptional regulator
MATTSCSLKAATNKIDIVLVYLLNGWYNLIMKSKLTHVCYHCRTGMIIQLPSRCPECDKWLTEEIVMDKGEQKINVDKRKEKAGSR